MSDDWNKLKHLVDLSAENARLKAEVERLKAVSTIEQRTIQGLQQTPEWSEIARLTAYCRELEGKVSHIDLFKSVVEKFFNSADLKNPPDAQSCYALAEKLKQLPDSILDFTEEQVRDNPAWSLAVFRHKVKEMQYKRIHDLNEIGGEQEENARIMEELEQRCRELNLSIGQQAVQLRQIGELKEYIERSTAQYNGIIDTQLKVIDELKAEVERLKAEKDQAECDYDNCQRRKVSIDNHRFDLFTENKNLKAEVERLRKAGDALAETLESVGFDSANDFWNAAKEGKPHA